MITTGALLASSCAARGLTPAEVTRRMPPEERARAVIAAWGEALRSGDDARRAEHEDGEGRIALVYGAVKLAASTTPRGAEAVEMSVGMTILMFLLMVLQGRGEDAPLVAAVPVAQGLGPTLVAAGLADASDEDGKTVFVALPWRETGDRLAAADARHLERLRAAQPWTCRPVKIEATVLPEEPTLMRAAEVSRNIFAAWHRKLETIWVVRAECATGPGVFVLSAIRVRGDALRDQVLLAWATPPPGAAPAP